MSKIAYRPDIDGLRAVAVILVLQFHAGLGFPGGFIGVDVFFVISGYLITGIILRDLADGTFRLTEFWNRRIRRIAPASLLMTLVTLLVGGLLLLPADFEELGASAMTHIGMASNFYFLRKTGYFDGPADLKPLLHTWSLSIEEQFYVVYPLLLMVLGRFPRRWTFIILALLTGASLWASIRGVHTSPSATFFLLPTRAWELILGGMLWSVPSPSRLGIRWIQAIGLAGAVAILTSAWWYSAATPFPGLAAIPPCVGAVALIFSNGDPRSWMRHLLSQKPLVQIGLMSYSLYLWHWPIIVFLRYRLSDEFTLAEQWLSLVASFVIGYLSWRYVENPVRLRTLAWSWRAVCSTFAVAASCVLLVGWSIQHHDGYPGRYSPEMQRILASMEAPRHRKTVALTDVEQNRLPAFGDLSSELKCLIWGDSHAMAIIPALEEVCLELKIRGLQATYDGTLPFLDFTPLRSGVAPEQYDEAVLELIHEEEIDVVILAGYWSRDSHDLDFRPSLKETIQTLTAAGVHVILVQDIPIQYGDAGSLIAAPLRQEIDLESVGVALVEHRRHQLLADTALAEMVGDQVTLVDPTPYLLDETGNCRIVMNGESLYSDRHHLSLAGARRLKPLFTQLLTKLETTLESADKHPVTDSFPLASGESWQAESAAATEVR